MSATGRTRCVLLDSNATATSLGARGKFRLGFSFEECGRQRGSVMAELEAMRAGDVDWRGGRVPLYVFSGPPDVQEVGRQAFNMFFRERLRQSSFPLPHAQGAGGYRLGAQSVPRA
jgi:hypothetical protein